MPDGYKVKEKTQYLGYCDENHEIYFAPKEGYCVFGEMGDYPEVVVAEGEGNPDNPCEFCNTSVSQTEWTNAPSQVRCGYAFSGYCVEGECIYDE